ncbi:MAG: hypothetical protein ABIQ64_00650, partial [Candidatus Saccharimonadales bacterium]
MNDSPSIDRDLKRQHWDKYNPVNHELIEVVEPLAKDFADAVAELGTDNERLKSLCNTYLLPYGRMSKLPPALFGTITKDTISLDRPLFVPTDDDEIEEIATKYNEWAVGLAQTGDYSYASVPTRDVLVETMKRLKGQPYPEDQWKTSALITQSALINEPTLGIDIHRVAQINGGAYELDQLSPSIRHLYKQQSMYTLALSQLVPEDGRTLSVRELVQLPVGEYGIEPAERMARAVVLLGDFIRTSPDVDASIAALTSP